jgi:hypothetical protein
MRIQGSHDPYTVPLATAVYGAYLRTQVLQATYA